MARLRVLICDVDGTLVDSAAFVARAVAQACGDVGVAAPVPGAVRVLIGLSVEVMFARLGHPAAGAENAALSAAFRAAYGRMRVAEGYKTLSPLFPGAEAALRRLAAEPGTLLAIATGKSRRGADALIADHGLDGLFASIQTADTHPSKPDPSMIHAVLRETGAVAGACAMLGDTSFDAAMARAAGVVSIGVHWGNHSAAAQRANHTLHRFDDLEALFATLTAERAETETLQ